MEKETIWEKISKSKTSVILVGIIVGMLVVLTVSLPYIITLSRQSSLSSLTTSTTPLTETSETEGKIVITVPTVTLGTRTEQTPETVIVSIYRTVVNGETIVTYKAVTIKPSSIKIISPTIAEIAGFRIEVINFNGSFELDGYKYLSKYFALFTISVTNLNPYPKYFGVIGEYLGKEGSTEIAVLDWWNNKFYPFEGAPSKDSKIKWDTLPQLVDVGETRIFTLAFSVPIECTELRIAFRSAFDEEWGDLPMVYKAEFRW